MKVKTDDGIANTLEEREKKESQGNLSRSPPHHHFRFLTVCLVAPCLICHRRIHLKVKSAGVMHAEMLYRRATRFACGNVGGTSKVSSKRISTFRKVEE